MQVQGQNKRVVVVYWKNNPSNPIEVFSSLKNFCLSYSNYNYNTLSNYLSKEKVAYDNEKVRVERKNVFLKPKPVQRNIQPVIRQVALKEAEDHMQDLHYWLSRSPIQRLSAVTLLSRQMRYKGQQMDKSTVVKRKLKR
jgi:hypothetical protein